MEYKKYDCDSYNIHTIKTDKFKTIRMEIIFRREVKKEELPLFTFLSDILTDCSKDYQRRKDMAIRLEELYKSIFYGVTNKTGNLYTISFIFEFIDPEYINDPDYLKEAVSFPFKVINNPKVKNKEFDLTNFNIIRKRLLEEIESLKESSDRLAIIKALEKMDNTSPSSFKVFGEREEVLNITPHTLYEAYLELLKTSNCDIFVIGNYKMDEIVKIIKDSYINRVIKISKPKLIVNNKLRKKPLVVKEKSNFVQSTLVMVYNIKDLTKEMRNSAFYVFNYIFGSGGITSKLYESLRSKNSLCYAVRSLYLKYDELLVIEVSLDKKNVGTARKLIEKAVSEMVKGKFLDTTLEDAKKNLAVSLKMSSDNNVSILSNYIFHVFDNMPLLEERSTLIQKVKREDVIKCAKSLSLNTVYIQDASDNGGEE